MKRFILKYLIGGYGSFGRVIEDDVYANTAEEVLSKFEARYKDLLDCVKPKILGLYLVNKHDFSLTQIDL